MLAAAIDAARDGPDGGAVLDVLRRAAGGQPPASLERDMGWVLLALHNAVFHLAAGTPVEAALIRTASAGGDTDTNAAVTGALLGAADGRAGFPARWTMPVLTARAEAGLGVVPAAPGGVLARRPGGSRRGAAADASGSAARLILTHMSAPDCGRWRSGPRRGGLTGRAEGAPEERLRPATTLYGRREVTVLHALVGQARP